MIPSLKLYPSQTPLQGAIESFNETVLSDPATSTWVKTQWEALSKRDCVDALNDLEILQLMLTNKLNGLTL
ncbi:hypothetical protein ACROAH_21360 [Shewanella oncorhynchi]|uniref:hypothetical protein n=1 Tax=Shewanella oncorhynchi TaxID=2726434 RepID=UPI003D7A24EC